MGGLAGAFLSERQARKCTNAIYGMEIFEVTFHPPETYTRPRPAFKRGSGKFFELAWFFQIF
jgi:hypothetical protein